MIRTLLFSTLYPSSSRPIHGIFVETRLRELLKSGEVETRVVAPVPWFPVSGERFGAYGKFAATPLLENRNGVEVHHPRYFLPPKIGMNIAPYTLALGALPSLKRLLRDGFDFDLIDAHYYYPDGVAAGLLGKWLGKPFVVTARGTDLNLISQYAIPGRLILQTAIAACASIGVSKALADKLAGLGVAEEKLRVFRNGVDLERFRPESKGQARQRLGLPASTILLSVGNLVELKGHHVAIRALLELPPTVLLVIAGSGPQRRELERLVDDLHLRDRVVFAGEINNADLKWWYSAADALVLCSEREGWPNVLLEAMACGVPAIATRVGGVPEIITSPVAGQIMRDGTPQAMAEAFNELFSKPPLPADVRAFAEEFGWNFTTRAQIDLFRELINRQNPSLNDQHS